MHFPRGSWPSYQESHQLSNVNEQNLFVHATNLESNMVMQLIHFFRARWNLAQRSSHHLWIKMGNTVFKWDNVRMGNMVIYEKGRANIMAIPHILITITDNGGNKVRTASKQWCRDICLVTMSTSQCLLVTIYINPGMSLCDVQFLSYYLTVYSPNISHINSFLATEGCHDKLVMLAGFST